MLFKQFLEWSLCWPRFNFVENLLILIQFTFYYVYIDEWRILWINAANVNFIGHFCFELTWNWAGLYSWSILASAYVVLAFYWLFLINITLLLREIVTLLNSTIFIINTSLHQFWFFNVWHLQPLIFAGRIIL